MTIRLVAYLKHPKLVSFGFSNIVSLLLSLVLLPILSAVWNQPFISKDNNDNKDLRTAGMLKYQLKINDFFFYFLPDMSTANEITLISLRKS